MQPKSWTMNPALVGREMAKEIAAVHWSENRFYFTSPNEFANAMIQDHFNLGISPLDHIRNISIRIEHRNKPRYLGEQIGCHLRVYIKLQHLTATKLMDLLKIELQLETSFEPRSGMIGMISACNMSGRCSMYWRQ